MTDAAELVATFQPILEDVRAQIDSGIGDSRAMELEIELTVELRRFDLAAGAMAETAKVTAFREEIKALLRRLAKGHSTNVWTKGASSSPAGINAD